MMTCMARLLEELLRGDIRAPSLILQNNRGVEETCLVYRSQRRMKETFGTDPHCFLYRGTTSGESDGSLVLLLQEGLGRAGGGEGSRGHDVSKANNV